MRDQLHRTLPLLGMSPLLPIIAVLSKSGCSQGSLRGDSLAQVVLILFAVALSQSDQAASFSMLGFYFLLFTSCPIIPSLLLWSILFGLNSCNHLPHLWHVINTAPCSSQIQSQLACSTLYFTRKTSLTCDSGSRRLPGSFRGNAQMNEEDQAVNLRREPASGPSLLLLSV